MRKLLPLILLLMMAGPALASQKLKQNTATEVTLKFVDATDGITAETALDVTTFDCNLVKHADASRTATALTVTASGGSNDSTHLADGIYRLELTATNTDTLRELDLYCQCAGAAPYEAHFTVSAAADPEFAGDFTSTADVVAAIHEDPVPGSYAAGTAGYVLGHVRRPSIVGTADSGTTTTIVDAALTQADTGYFAGSMIVFTSGTMIGQARYITGFTPASDTLTFTPALTQDTNTETYEIWPLVSLLTVPKNTAYDNFTFSMVDATDGQTLETGLTVSGTISKDGGAFSALTNSVSEIGTTGRYKVTLTAVEMTADEVYLAFTATGARRVEFKIRPQK